MPFGVRRQDCRQSNSDQGRWVVYRTDTGKVVSCHTSQALANQARRIRQQNSPDKMSNRHASMLKGTGETTIEQAVLDVDKSQGIVTAVWSRFGNLDSDGDIIDFGAYAKTIAEQGPKGSNRIKVLWNHFELIGRPISLEESKEHNGLVVRQKIAPTTMGRNALLLYFDDVITEHSVRISSIRRKGEDPPDFAHIVETRLWEGGPQIWGANPLTPTLEAKSALGAIDLQVLHGQILKAQDALKTGITDDLAEELEIMLDDLRVGFIDLKTLLTGDSPVVKFCDRSDVEPSTPVGNDHLDNAPTSTEDWMVAIAKAL